MWREGGREEWCFFVKCRIRMKRREKKKERKEGGTEGGREACFMGGMRKEERREEDCMHAII